MLLETKIKTETFLPEKTWQTTSTVSQIKSENFQSHDCWPFRQIFDELP